LENEIKANTKEIAGRLECMILKEKVELVLEKGATPS
jgi:hypothetical protein